MKYWEGNTVSNDMNWKLGTVLEWDSRWFKNHAVFVLRYRRYREKVRKPRGNYIESDRFGKQLETFCQNQFEIILLYGSGTTAAAVAVSVVKRPLFVHNANARTHQNVPYCTCNNTKSVNQYHRETIFGSFHVYHANTPWYSLINCHYHIDTPAYTTHTLQTFPTKDSLLPNECMWCDSPA